MLKVIISHTYQECMKKLLHDHTMSMDRVQVGGKKAGPKMERGKNENETSLSFYGS